MHGPRRLHVPWAVVLCDHVAVLCLHRGLVWPSLCLFSQHEVRGGVAAGTHLYDKVMMAILMINICFMIFMHSLMNAICSFIGIYFDAKNRPHITFTKEEAKVRLCSIVLFLIIFV